MTLKSKCPECQFEQGHSQGCSKYKAKEWGKIETLPEFNEKWKVTDIWNKINKIINFINNK